jgi:dihydroxyacid dehydratase/phosphogluconate dehydratase
LAELYVEAGLQNQDPSSLVATSVADLPPLMGQIVLEGDVTTFGSQYYRGNRVLVGTVSRPVQLISRDGSISIEQGPSFDGVARGSSGMSGMLLRQVLIAKSAEIQTNAGLAPAAILLAQDTDIQVAMLMCTSTLPSTAAEKC